MSVRKDLLATCERLLQYVCNHRLDLCNGACWHIHVGVPGYRPNTTALQVGLSLTRCSQKLVVTCKPYALIPSQTIRVSLVCHMPTPTCVCTHTFETSSAFCRD